MASDALKCEPATLHLARRCVACLPFGRSSIVRNVAKVCGHRQPFMATIGDLRFEVDLGERVSRTLYLYGVFEPAVTEVFVQLLAPDQTVFDVGANFGYYTLMAAKRVGSGGTVYAFEPDPRNIGRLQRNVAANALTNIRHQPVGLFDHVGTVRFNLASSDEDNLGSSSILEAGPGRQCIEIGVTTLDEFLRGVEVPRIDLLKMDIEGAEFAALQGGAEAIGSRRITHYLLEMHQTILDQDKIRQIRRWFADAGYQAWFVREEVTAAKPRLTDLLAPIDDATFARFPNPHCLFSTVQLL